MDDKIQIKQESKIEDKSQTKITKIEINNQNEVKDKEDEQKSNEIEKKEEG